MTTPRFCEQCGGPLADGVAFCESCGAAVPRDGADAPATEPAAAAPVAAAPVAPTAAAGSPAPTGSAGRGSPRWVPLAILVAGILVIVASIVSSL